MDLYVWRQAFIHAYMYIHTYLSTYSDFVIRLVALHPTSLHALSLLGSSVGLSQPCILAKRHTTDVCHVAGPSYRQRAADITPRHSRLSQHVDGG
jgi:hypothetical protein